MTLPTLYTPFEAAEKLGRSQGWLQSWLRDNPNSKSGMPYFAQVGRTKRFTDDNIRWIGEAIKNEALERFYRNTAAKSTNTGIVYFIESGEFIKIGYTRDTANRAKKMLTDSPVELKLLHAEPGTFKSEKTIHRHFAALRVRGEWFRKSTELLDYIEQRKRIAAGDA